jgi:hypothetical protein
MAILDPIDLNEDTVGVASGSGSGHRSRTNSVSSSPAIPLAHWYESKKKQQKVSSPPTLPAHLITTLRLLTMCPLCADEYSTLRLNDETGVVEQVLKRKTKKKAAAVKAKTITGPAKLHHLSLCAFRAGASEAVVVELVQREQVSIDKKRRMDYIEEQQRHDVWRTVVGQAPPCSQLQANVLRQREQGRHDFFIDKYVKDSMAQQQRRKSVSPVKPNQSTASHSKTKKAATTAIRSRLGHRGGIDRATTTIDEPRRRCESVKRQCRLLFGSESRRDGMSSGCSEVFTVYDWSDTASLMPFERSDAYQLPHRGLGFGACGVASTEISLQGDSDTQGRLSMGRMLAKGIVEEIAKREREGSS